MVCSTRPRRTTGMSNETANKPTTALKIHAHGSKKATTLNIFDNVEPW